MWQIKNKVHQVHESLLHTVCSVSTYLCCYREEWWFREVCRPLCTRQFHGTKDNIPASISQFKTQINACKPGPRNNNPDFTDPIMPFWQAVTDNSQHLENQTKLQHSSPAPGTTGYPPNPNVTQRKNMRPKTTRWERIPHCSLSPLVHGRLFRARIIVVRIRQVRT